MSKNTIYIIGAPNILEKKIRKIIGGTLETVRRTLRYSKPINVAVFEAPSEMVIPEIGMTGSAIGKSGIEIRIDFRRKFGKEKFVTELSSSICHETVHLVREDTVGYNTSLLDTMINEGIACYIEKVFSPKRHIFYIAPIKDESKFLKKAKPIFFKKNFNYSEWFFGSKKFPKWVGYRIGYLIVNGYTKKNKILLPRLVRMKSRDILSGSGMI